MGRGLFVNILIIITPVFFYQFFLLDRVKGGKASKLSEWLFGVLSGVSSILCMNFPIVSGEGYLWDLRWVPYVIGHLYGGWRGGVMALVLTVSYRASLGGGMAWVTAAIVAVVITAVLPWFRSRFQAYGRNQKFMFSVLVALLTFVWAMSMICYYFYYIHNFGYILKQDKLLFGFMAMSYVLGMIVSVFLIENIFENAKIREEVQRTEKLNIISQLAASVAHEVRNPLTVVRGFIQLARNSMDRTNQGYMDTAIAELDRAEFIISDYLNFAKPEIEVLEVVNVTEQLHGVTELMNSFAVMQKVEILTSFDDDLYIHVDRLKFKQVMMNLIKNGIEAIPNGGRIQVLTVQDGEHAVMKVIDSGVGMNREELERLGHPFYSTKDKGTGLGLMVTFRLVEAMRGRLIFNSEKGRGTEAVIRIPLANRPLELRQVQGNLAKKR